MIPQLRELLLLCLYALPAWALLRGGWLLMRRPGRLRPLREVVMCLFIVFMAAVLCMALEGKWAAPQQMLQSALRRLQTGDKLHLRPGQIIGMQLRHIRRGIDPLRHLTQLLGNTLLFAPWGFCLPLLWRRFRGALRMIGMSLLLTCCIECTQLFIDRYVEFDDLLLNFAGSMLGAGAWRCVHRLFPALDAHLL